VRAPAKVGVVVGGYAVALPVAYAVVVMYIAATSGPDRQAYGAMYAFGDDLLFLAVFGIVAVPPSGATLYFLRPHRSFWRALSVGALTIAVTAGVALVAYVAARSAETGSGLHGWFPLAALRMLAGLLFAPAFMLAGVFAPHRSFRIALFVAAVVEAAAFACFALNWLQGPSR
jgi:hypothetical protein